MEGQKNGKQLQVDIPTATVLKVIFIILFFVFLYLLVDVLIILLFAIIIASAVSPFADWLDEKKFPRLLGVILLYLSIFAMVLFLLSLVIPFISLEINQLTKDLPEFIQNVSTSIEEAQEATSSRYFDFFNEILNLLDGFSEYLAISSQSVFSFIISIFGGILSFLAIIVISFYFSYMKNGIEKFVRAVLPKRYESTVLSVWKRSERKVGRWLQGQLLLALLIGLSVYVGLSLLGIKFALLLGIIAMILELVPGVGPVLAAIPAIILAFVQGPAILGVWVILLYTIIQQIENHVLVPIVLGRTVGLNPVVVIISLLIGAKLAGILGVIIAVPVAAILVEVLEEIAHQTGYKKVDG
jgi:predicted PurR-regulated permease PerM